MCRTAIAYLLPGDPVPPPPPGVRILELAAEHDPRDRAGLRAVAERLSRGEADTLLVARLNSIRRPLGDLLRLLDWLAAEGVTLLCLEPPLDTATERGQASVRLLREVAGWDGRRGRPGLAHADPGLAERIGALREAGLSLQAIADRLNAEGVPTPRGGQGWRPSSVQSALGYRRPRPPAVGHPPPRRRPGRGPRHPHSGPR
jgi:hypothetical protein